MSLFFLLEINYSIEQVQGESSPLPHSGCLTKAEYSHSAVQPVSVVDITLVSGFVAVCV